MISMYELKLGNEKLEALNFLLESTKDLTAALQELDVSGLKSETAEIKENIAKASALNQSLKELRAHLENNDFSSLLAAYNEAKPRLDGFDAKMSEFDEKYAKIEDAAASLPEIKTKIEQATQLLENALPGLTAKIDEFNQKIADGQTKLEQTSQDFQTKYGELVKLKGELETLKGEINTLLLQGVINDEQTATTTTFSSVKIKSELDALKNQIPDTSNLLTSESAEQTFAKKTDVPDVSGKLDTATAETTYAKKIEIPNVSGFLKSEVAEKTYMKKGEVPNIDGLVTKEDAEKIYAKKDDVSLSLETKLGKNEKASDSAMLEGNAANAFVKIADVSSEASPNKIVKRNEAGDIYTKAIYSEKLNLSSTVEDGALVANSTVLFSENGSELVRKASIGKLKELVASEADLSGYVKKSDVSIEKDKDTIVKRDEQGNIKANLLVGESLQIKGKIYGDNVFNSSCSLLFRENSTQSIKGVSPSIAANLFARTINHFHSSDNEEITITLRNALNFYIYPNTPSKKNIPITIDLDSSENASIGRSGLIICERPVNGFSGSFKMLEGSSTDYKTKTGNVFSYYVFKDNIVLLSYCGNYK